MPVNVGHPEVEDDVHGKRTVRDPVYHDPAPLRQGVEPDAKGDRDDAESDQYCSESVVHTNQCDA